MIINIHPNRINTASGSGVKAKEKDLRRRSEPETEIPTPRKAHVNYLPTPESLATLISGAVTALRKGIRWDRGTILNLLV